MMKGTAVICFLVMTGIAHPQSLNPATFVSLHASHDVPLETDPISAFWKKASPIYIVGDNWGKAVPGYRTEVRSRWTKDSLYILFVCPYRKLNLKPNPSTTTETNQLWNWDVAEIFIGSDFQNILHYKEFEISPQGEWVDLDINLNRPHHEDGWTWNSGFQVAARIDPSAKIWYGAMRIPSSAIDPHALRLGATFRANLFRVEGPSGDKKSLSWQPTMSETFHVPEKFGRLVLAGVY